MVSPRRETHPSLGAVWIAHWARFEPDGRYEDASAVSGMVSQYDAHEGKLDHMDEHKFNFSYIPPTRRVSSDGKRYAERTERSVRKMRGVAETDFSDSALYTLARKTTLSTNVSRHKKSAANYRT